MTTHKDRKLGRKIMKPVKGPMILGKEGMPQYDNSKGSTTRSKVSEAYVRLDALGEGGMTQYVMENKRRCASKLLYSEICSSIM